MRVSMLSILRYLALVFICQFAWSCNSPENHSIENDHQAIRGVLDDQLKAWNDGNIDGFMEGYWNNDSLLFMAKRGPQYGWETLRGMYHKSFPNREKMGNLKFEVENIRPVNEWSYLVIGRWLVDQGADQKSGYFTLIFKKIEEKWLIITDHTFSD